MSKRISHKFVVSLVALFSSIAFSVAQEAYGSFSPYSFYGVGDLSMPGSAYNKSMGGVGIAGRNNRYLNILNPAAVTARDSLAFMATFSLSQSNKIYKQGDYVSANNIFNVNDLVFSFPIYKSSAMMLGLVPYSNMGYAFTGDIDADLETIVNSGGVPSYSATGIGSMYKVFAAAGVTFLKKISIGAELDYYFGSFEKTYATTFSDYSFSYPYDTEIIQLNGIAGKFGMQYEQPFGNGIRATIGATYSTNAKLKGYYEAGHYSVGSASTDTLTYTSDTVGMVRNSRLASEIGIGISLKKDNKWMAEFNYTRSDWTSSNLANISGYNLSTIPFIATVSEAYRVGFEYIPNIYDIRYYFNTVAYRVGAYYKTEHYTLSGHTISSVGLTLGATLPVFRWYNGITIGMELGQRASLSGDLTRERYINFSFGINIFDIWFQKPQYE